MLEQESLIQ